MTFFGPSTRMEQVDYPDRLEFRFVPVLRGFHLAVVALIAGGVLTDMTNIRLGVVVGASAAGLWYLWKRHDDTARVLQVSDTVLEAFGRGEPEHLRWGEVMRLEYRNGGENEPSGLAAQTGWSHWTWLVKDIPKQQADQVIGTIFRRFPLVNMAPEPPGLLAGLLGKLGSGSTRPEDV